MPLIALKKIDICDEAEAEILATKIHNRILECHKPDDPIALFRIINPPPKHDVLVATRNIIVEDLGYENMEWYYHDDFMWDIIVCRRNIPLL